MIMDCSKYVGPCSCGRTHELETKMVVVEYNALSRFEEYMAADMNSEVTVETYIQGANSWWDGKITLPNGKDAGAIVYLQSDKLTPTVLRLPVGVRLYDAEKNQLMIATYCDLTLNECIASYRINPDQWDELAQSITTMSQTCVDEFADYGFDDVHVSIGFMSKDEQIVLSATDGEIVDSLS